MSRIAAPILLSDQERTTLQTWARARSQAQRVVQRAQIILLAADGVESQVIAQRLRVSRPTVQLWRERFVALRTEGSQKTRLLRVAFLRFPTIRSPQLWRRRCTVNHRTPRTGAHD